MLLCGSRNSPHLCLYDTGSHALAYRLTVTSNRSLSGVQVLLNSKNMTDAGASWQEFDLSDSDADDVEVTRRRNRIRQATSLPGVSVGEAKDMYTERELHVWDVAFSADAHQLAAATTHGVFVYVADTGLGTPSAADSIHVGDVGRFVPQMLTRNVTAPAILRALEAGEHSRAMILALALNDYGLLRKAYEAVPSKSIPVVVASIGAPLLPALLWFLSSELRPSTGTPHFQFHVDWVAALIDLHFLTLSEMVSGRPTAARTGAALEAASASRTDVAALCLQLLVELSQRHASMVKLFDGNAYLLRYLGGAPAEGSGGGDALAPPDVDNERRKPAEEAASASDDGGGTTRAQLSGVSRRPKKRRKRKAAAVAAAPEKEDSPT